jgi:hypothetical protein
MLIASSTFQGLQRGSDIGFFTRPPYSHDTEGWFYDD